MARRALHAEPGSTALTFSRVLGEKLAGDVDRAHFYASDQPY